MNRYVRGTAGMLGAFIFGQGLGMLHESLPYIVGGFGLILIWVVETCKESYNKTMSELAAKKEADHA
jgi:hypothetical protein